MMSEYPLAQSINSSWQKEREGVEASKARLFYGYLDRVLQGKSGAGEVWLTTPEGLSHGEQGD
jgi:hypothetical protein